MEREEWVPMTSADRDNGLTYENFRRTIIIPQGSLRSFRLEEQERSDMMKFSSSAF
jgi:exonuclease SbcC